MISAHPTPTASQLLNPAQTAERLPYPKLLEELVSLLQDRDVQVPPRLVLAPVVLLALTLTGLVLVQGKGVAE